MGRQKAIFASSSLLAESCLLTRTHTHRCTESDSSRRIQLPPNLDSGTLFLTTRKSTRPPEKSSLRRRSPRRPPDWSRTSASGSDTILDLELTTCYRDMGARHRARPGSIQILRVERLPVTNAAGEKQGAKRPHITQLLDSKIRFPLPRRIISRKQQNAPRFATKRPSTM